MQRVSKQVKQQIDKLARQYPDKFYLCSCGGQRFFTDDLALFIQWDLEESEADSYKELAGALESSKDDLKVKDSITRYLMKKVKLPEDDADFVKRCLWRIDVGVLSEECSDEQYPLSWEFTELYNGVYELKRRYVRLVEKCAQLEEQIKKGGSNG